jgi:glycosyltransferase involved in cell wall biosynthesis
MAKSANISVVVTTSGRARMLADCLRSIGAQSAHPSQVVVVDAGSGIPIDTTLTNCATKVLRLPMRVGPCGARNAGLLEATGTHVHFLDDDDLLPPGAIATYLNAISDLVPHERDHVAFLGAIGFFQDPDPPGSATSSVPISGVNLPPSLPCGAHYSLERIPGNRQFKVHNSLVAPRTTLKLVGGWDIRLPASEHTDLFLRLNAVCRLVGIDEVLYLMRRHPMARLSANAQMNAAGMRLTFEKHRDVFLQHRAATADYLSLAAVRYAQAGLLRPAILMLVRSARTRPNMLAARRAMLVANALLRNPSSLSRPMSIFQRPN